MSSTDHHSFEIRDVLRLDAVSERLGDVIDHGDVESVHELRIAIRKALVGLDLCRDVLRKRDRKWMRKNLRGLLGVAGETRDLDVMIGRYQEASCVYESLSQRRIRSIKKLQQAGKRLLRTGRLERRYGKLLNSAQESSKSVAVAESKVEKRLSFIAQDFFTVARTGSFKPKPLHRLRKRGKRLRYAIDALFNLLPRSEAKEFQRIAKRLQARLGDLNDHSVACRRLSKMVSQAKSKKAKKHLKELHQKERELLSQSIEGLRSVWTEERVDELESEMQRLVQSVHLCSH